MRPILIFDEECYINYWLFKVYDPTLPGTSCCKVELFEGGTLDKETIRHFLDNYTLVSFNGLHYDEPMLTYAMAGATCAQLKMASDLIIQGGLKSWEFYDHFNLNRLQGVDHIDLKEVAKGVNVSLKTYGGRLGSASLQDLPLHPSTRLTTDQMRQIDHPYCTNDLLTTHDLYLACKPAIDLRIAMSAEHGIDLRSKSDAQMAESIFKVQLGFVPERAYWAHGTPFQYKAPGFIQFPNNPYMQGVLSLIENAVFTTSDADQVDELFDDQGKKIKTGIIMPPEVKNLIISIGRTKYKMGIGGLHSQESAMYYVANEYFTICDADVTSYYPSLILVCGMFPKQLGQRFLDIYRAVYDGRLEAKHLAAEVFKQIEACEAMGNPVDALRKEYVMLQVKSDGLKIVLNGTFGKLGSKYSIMFAPDLLLQVTLTGQLSLLMLICMLEDAGITVISANTDGVVMCVPRGYEFLRDQIIKYWESCTGLGMEYTFYKSYFARDVNNYVSFKLDGKYKSKGIFAKTGIDKNPTNSICTTAVIDYLGNGVPLETTIYGCKDVKQFLTVRNVKGGAIHVGHKELPYHETKEQLLKAHGIFEVIDGRLKRWNGQTLGAAYKDLCETLQRGAVSDVLGKVVRFYLRSGEKGNLAYASNGNLVPNSTGAWPLMHLNGQLPPDLDYARYVEIASDMLATLGIK